MTPAALLVRLDAIGDALTLRPDALGLLGLARAHWATGDSSDPWFLEPTYLRPSAAEEKSPAPQDSPKPS